MRYLFFNLLLLSLNALTGQIPQKGHFQIGDTLYVAAKNGLNLRSQPNSNSTIIEKINLNETVIVDSVLMVDTISNRIGNWVQVFRKKTSGYLFDGYLNKFEIKTGKYLFGNYIKNYLVESYKMSKSIIIYRPCNGGKSCKRVQLFSSENCILKTEYGWEWWDMEIILKNWNINEVLNILENSDCYMDVCDYEKAIINRKENEIQWETQTDDIFMTKIVQGENDNLQINISWSY